MKRRKINWASILIAIILILSMIATVNSYNNGKAITKNHKAEVAKEASDISDIKNTLTEINATLADKATVESVSGSINTLQTSLNALNGILTTLQAQYKSINIVDYSAQIATIQSNINLLKTSTGTLLNDESTMTDIQKQITTLTSEVLILENSVNSMSSSLIANFDSSDGFVNNYGQIATLGNNSVVARAQSFTLTNTGNVVGLAIYLNKAGAPSDIAISINSLDSSGNISANPIVSSTIFASSVAANTWTWNKINVIANLPAGKYALTMSVSSYSPISYYLVGCMQYPTNGPDLYPSGIAYTSTSGANWVKWGTSPSAFDYAFEIFGY